MNSNNKKKEEYLIQCAKFFRIAKDECYVPGKDMLTQNWSTPVDIYNAAVGIIQNSCKAYLIYKNKQVFRDVDLEQQQREVIENLNNEFLVKAFDSVLNLENNAIKNTITKAEAKNCLKEAKSIYDGILSTIPPSDRIKIGF